MTRSMPHGEEPIIGATYVLEVYGESVVVHVEELDREARRYRCTVADDYKSAATAMTIHIAEEQLAEAIRLGRWVDAA